MCLVVDELYIDTPETEHIEMYLKAIWSISERKEEVKISSIARLLDIRQPIVVQMFHMLNDAGLCVEFNNRFIEICMHRITSEYYLFKYFTASDFAYCLLI
jgi:Iron dependent repressor, N-terminal DNA binding domain